MAVYASEALFACMERVGDWNVTLYLLWMARGTGKL